MHVTLEKSQLSIATNRLQGAIGDRALAQIAIRTNQESQTIELASLDRIMAVYNTLTAHVEKIGTAFVPGKLFSDVVRQLPDGPVKLSTVDNLLMIQAESGFEMKIPLIEEASWKEPPVIMTENTAPLNAARVLYMIEQVQFCIDDTSSRNYGTVGYFHRVDDGRIRLVGTDGFRLSYSDARFDVPEKFLQRGVCLSKRALVELHKMSSAGYETINVVIDNEETTLMAAVADYRIYIRLSTVKYPNYRGVIPTANLNPVRLSRQLLQSVTKRVLIAADKNNTLKVSFDDNVLTMSSRTNGNAESKESLPLVGFRGAKAQMAVNGKFLGDVVAALPSEELTLQYKSDEHPIVIIPREEPIDCRSLHVVVPLKDNI